MKSLPTLALLAAALTCAAPASAQKKDKEAEKARTEQAVRKALEARAYTVSFDYMNPMKGRGRTLTSNYSIEVRNDSLFSYLPYAGEAYNVPYGGGKALNFNAPIAEYSQEAGKKGRTEITLDVRNEEDHYTYRLTVFPDGNATLYVQPTHRQSISFSGEMETEE